MYSRGRLTWICLLVEPVQVATVLRTCLRSADPTNRTLKVSAKGFKETMEVIKYSMQMVIAVTLPTIQYLWQY